MLKSFLLFSILVVVSISFAQMGDRGAQRGAKGFGQRMQMMNELNLTPEQKQKMIEIQKTHLNIMKEKRSTTEKARNDLLESMRGNGSETELRSLHNALQTQENEFNNARFEHMLVIRALLTPEQRKKMKDFREQQGLGFGNRQNCPQGECLAK